MSVLGLALRNLGRKPFRNLLTMIGVVVAVGAFVLLRTVKTSWENNSFAGVLDRSYVRNKVAPTNSMPINYVEKIRAMPKVKAATAAIYEGGQYPRLPNLFFNCYFVDPRSYLEVFHEMELSQADRTRWFGDRQSAIVGDKLADKLGVKIGDRITLRGLRYSGDWTYTIAGIYRSPTKTIDRMQLLAHWSYLNESVPEQRRDQVQFVMIRADRPEDNAAVGAAIDRAFAGAEPQTLTLTELQVQAQFLGFFSTVIVAVEIVSYLILLIALLLVGNTIAMSLRERTREYAVLRAIGFQRRVVLLMGLESLLVAGAGGLIGIALAIPFIRGAVAPVVEDAMESFLSSFTVQPATIALAAIFAIALGVFAVLLPARRAMRTPLVDALRRVG
jgi:putative ABC transport system permease protein